MDYRVYRSGETEPVRVEARTPRDVPPLTRPPAPAERRRDLHAQPSRPRLSWLVWPAAALAAAAAAVLFWLYGREMLGNSLAALDLARLSGKVPEWAIWAAPAIAAALLVLVTFYLAFGRHLVVKSLAVVVTVLIVGLPGFALGWANGTVSTVGDRSDEVQSIVSKAKEELRPELPGKAVNILLIGCDKSKTPGDTGRSDSQILVRLDPATKSISMLSIPRDLRVDIPGYGYTKMNAAYSYGGSALVVKTFKGLTGLPVNHFVEVNFAGFWHLVNILGGVYIPVDHRYYNPESSDYKSIDIQPGYQLLHGHDSLDFVRFRHDQQGDFTRMQRQQLFLKELQRQSSRWSSDWSRVLRLIKAITAQTTSDIDSLKRLKPLVELIFQVNTSKVYTTRLEGSTPMVDGVSYVEASDTEVAEAVSEFTDPTQSPVKSGKVPKKQYLVTVHNTTDTGGLATSVVSQLATQGYSAEVSTDAPESATEATIVYAPTGLKTQAQAVGQLLWPSDVRIVKRAPGVLDGIEVFVGSDFDGTITVPQEDTEQADTTQTLEKERYDVESWRALDARVPMHLEMPTVWSSGFTYDQFRSYSIKTTGGKQSAAAVAVGETSDGGYFDIQVMRWLDPPAIENPSSSQTVAGQKYLLFYQGQDLHMVAWKRRGTLYWVLNGFDNQLTNDTMMSIATSFKPVK